MLADGSRMVVAITCDFDTHSPWIGGYRMTSPEVLRAGTGGDQSSSGNWYGPGELCPHADAGMAGVAGDGTTLICDNNNGLRWDPT